MQKTGTNACARLGVDERRAIRGLAAAPDPGCLSRPGWLMAWLLEGERPVQVTVRITSGTGEATVDVERVDVSGVTIRGSALDFLISNFLLPYYPEAKIGKPFELGHRIDRLDIQPSGVNVVIGK